MTLKSSHPGMAALSSEGVFGSLPLYSILKFASCRYCPFLFKIFSYLIFQVAVVPGFFPSIRSSSWLLFVCMKMLVSKLKLRDTKQVNTVGLQCPLHGFILFCLIIFLPLVLTLCLAFQNTRRIKTNHTTGGNYTGVFRGTFKPRAESFCWAVIFFLIVPDPPIIRKF